VDNHSHDDRENHSESICKEKLPDQVGSLGIDNKQDTAGYNVAIIGSLKKFDNPTQEPACLVIHANKGSIELDLI
jgi:hypothetical protein